MNLDGLLAVDEPATARAGGLIADEQDGVAGIGQRGLQVMEDAASLGHAARRDHDRRRLRRRQLLGLLDGCDRRGTDRCRTRRRRAPAAPGAGGRRRASWRRRIVRRLVVANLRCELRIELVHALRVPRQRGGGHRAVDEDRQHRDATFGLEPAQPVDQLLHAADGKRRDDQLSATLDGLRDDRGQARPIVIMLVHAIAVGRFDEQIVGLR